MANLSNPLAEAIVKVKLDSSSFNQMRSQLEGLGKGTQNQVSQGLSSTAATAAAAGAGVKLAEAFSKGFGGKKEGIFNAKDIYKSFTEAISTMEEVYKRAGYTIEKTTANLKEGTFITTMSKDGQKFESTIESLNIKASNLFQASKKTTAEYRQMARAAYQLRGGLVEVAMIMRNIAVPIMGLAILGVRKYMQTWEAGSMEMRKSFGGLQKSWAQFQARLGDTVVKALGLNNVFKAMKDILDNVGTTTMSAFLNIAIWSGLLSVIFAMKAGILGLYGAIMRAAAGLTALKGAFLAAKMASGAEGWAGVKAGLGGVGLGKVSGAGVGAAITASLALMLAAFMGAFDVFIAKMKGQTANANSEVTKWATAMVALDKVLSYLGNFIKNLVVMFYDIGAGTMNFVLTALQGFWNVIAGIFTGSMKRIIDGFKSLGSLDDLFRKGIFQYLKDWWAMVSGKGEW